MFYKIFLWNNQLLVIKRGVHNWDFHPCFDLFLCYGPSLDLALEMQANLAAYKPLRSWHLSISTRVTKSFDFLRNFAIILNIETHALKMGYKIQIQILKKYSADKVKFIQAVCFGNESNCFYSWNECYFEELFFLIAKVYNLKHVYFWPYIYCITADFIYII